MKRKTRTITVNDEKFVWWYKIGNITEIKLSPISDKTSIITVTFPCKCNYIEEYVFSITMTKEDEEYCIIVIEPQMAGLLLSYLSEHKMFITRRNTYINGFDLLFQMGYSICEVKNGFWLVILLICQNTVFYVINGDIVEVQKQNL